MCESDFHVISRFRNDVVLYYPTLEKKTGKLGHPKWFDGKIDFGEGTSRIYAQGKHYQILAQDGEYSQLVVNEYGKGHSVYFAGLPYSPQNCRILLRAIYYAAGMPEEMKHYYVTNVDTEVTVFPETKRIAVINNADAEEKTDLYIKGHLIDSLTLAPREMRWVDDAE